MQYEIGKTFHADGKIEVCDNGLHFCIRMTDVFDYYEHSNGNRFFEVEADGIINSDGKKSAASGDGDGYGNGYGYDDGYGNGNGYGNGDGDGYGNGYGYDDGDGYGNGYGYDDGDGYGNGNIQKVLMFI